MRQVKLVLGKGGRVKILAHGTFGMGTADFTLALAKDLGTIIERHIGYHHTHTEEVNKQQEKLFLRNS